MSQHTKSDEGVGFYSVSQETSSAISDELAEQGYKVPEQSWFQHGGGGYTTVGRLIVGGEGNGGGSVHSSAENEIGYGSGLGFFTVGWLLTSGWIRIYPLLGLGGAGAGANIRTDTDETAQLMPSQDTKSTILQLGTLNPGISLSLGFELRLFRFVLGIRMGYVFTPLDEKHKGKPYMRMILGGSRKRNKG